MSGSWPPLSIIKEATNRLNKSTSKTKKNNNEIDLDLSSDEDERSGIMNCQEENEYDSKYGETRFLALDKCLPRRRWLEILEIEPDTSHASWKDENHR